MSLPVRLGVCILPTSRWADSRSTWMDLDMAGVDHLWTYDHLSWRDLRDGPWFGAMPLLAAIASVTTNALVGPLVASPNFRHPVPFAKEVMTAADISEGRFVCGVGAGGIGWDATVLGAPAWPRAERTARFEEFTELLYALLHAPSTTQRGAHYAAEEARMVPSMPVPLAIAATGRRGMALAARFGDWWITFGDAVNGADMSRDECRAAVAAQCALLTEACAAAGRDPGALRRLLLAGSTAEPWLASEDAFVELAHQYAAIGITDVVIHAPRTEPPHMADPLVFDRIIARIGGGE
jgi:alkanesulfonate monooxygenase SsuD/methylene tetrahydromethanopterin reductase-like flavin-dependent oxidoreductase (luciferase family)